MSSPAGGRMTCISRLLGFLGLSMRTSLLISEPVMMESLAPPLRRAPGRPSKDPHSVTTVTMRPSTAVEFLKFPEVLALAPDGTSPLS